MRKMLLVGLAFCAATIPAYSQTSWINPAGGSFNTAANWSPAVVPTSGVDAQVLIATSSPITIPSNAVNTFLLNNAGATMTQTGGSSFTTNGLFTLNAGSYTNTNGTINLNAGMVMNGGTFTQNAAIPNMNLTGTLTLNGGNFTLSGSLNGGVVAGGANLLKFGDGTLNGVSVGLDILNLSSGTARFTGGTTFAANSTYTLGTGVSLFFNQANTSNVAWVMGNSTGIYNNQPNTTWTIGSSGTASPAVSYAGGLSASITNAGITANNNLINDGLILNSGTGSLTIGVSANFTNSLNAVLRASSGQLNVNTDGNAFNDGLMESTGGRINLRPGGNFINDGTLTATSGTINIEPTGTGTNNGFASAVSGTIILKSTGLFANNGIIEIQTGGTVDIQRPVTIANLGTIQRASPTTGTLNLTNTSLTLTANTDLAVLGDLTLRDAGTITSGSGAPFQLSASGGQRIQLVPFNPGGIINNVNVDNGIINLATANVDLIISGNTTFANNTAITIGTQSGLRVSQPTLSNVAITIVDGGYVQGGITNSTWTIGPSGSSSPSILNTGSVTSIIGSTQPNNSLINNGDIENAGTGLLGINQTGSFINNGTIRSTNRNISIQGTGDFTNNNIISTNSGAIFIQPGGNFITGPGSQIIATGSGVVQLPRSSVTNGAIVNITNGTLNVNETGTATYTNIAAGTTTILSGSTANVGNSSSSAIVNNGLLTIGSSTTPGGIVNVGVPSSLGLVTNTNGLINLNGTLNSRVDITSGTLTGSGAINALPTASVIIGTTGRLAPGNSPGQIVIGGGLDVGGTLEIDIAAGGGNNSNTTGSTTPGNGFDTITVRPPAGVNTATDAVIRIATTTFRLNSGNTSQSQFNNDPFWNTPQRWAFLRTTSTNPGSIRLLDANGQPVSTLNDLVVANVRIFDSAGTNEFNPYISHPGGVFFYSLGSSSESMFSAQLDLVWSPVPVPEPTTIIAIAACGLGLVGYGRRLRQNRQRSIVNAV